MKRDLDALADSRRVGYCGRFRQSLERLEPAISRFRETSSSFGPATPGSVFCGLPRFSGSTYGVPSIPALKVFGVDGSEVTLPFNTDFMVRLRISFLLPQLTSYSSATRRSSELLA